MPTNEFLLWYPTIYPDAENICSFAEYADSNARIDGALQGALADCKSYNKVLYQVTRMCMALALTMVDRGFDVLDSQTPEQLAFNLQQAMVKVAGSSLSMPVRKSELLTTKVFADNLYEVPEYKVGTNTLMVFVDGLLIDEGTKEDGGGYVEVGTAGSKSTNIRFHHDKQAGLRITVISNSGGGDD